MARALPVHARAMALVALTTASACITDVLSRLATRAARAVVVRLLPAAGASLARRVHIRRGMTAATHAQIAELLGDVDDLFVKRLEDTGASLDEIGEALGDLEDEDRLGEPPRMASSPRVAEVRAILEELLDEGDDEVERGYREV